MWGETGWRSVRSVQIVNDKKDGRLTVRKLYLIKGTYNNFIIVVKFHGFHCLVSRPFSYVFQVQYQSRISKKSGVLGLQNAMQLSRPRQVSNLIFTIPRIECAPGWTLPYDRIIPQWTQQYQNIICSAPWLVSFKRGTRNPVVSPCSEFAQ